MARSKVVVIGAGVGGLSAAIHARLHGLEVTVFEQGRVGGKAAQIAQDGFCLDPGPSIIILPDIYRRVFAKAKKNPDEFLKFQRLDPITRVFQEESSGSIDLPADYKHCLEVVKEVSSSDADSLDHLMRMLEPISGCIDRSIYKWPVHSPLQLLNPNLIFAGMQFAKFESYKAYVDGAFESSLFRAFFYGFPSYSGQTYRGRGLGNLLIPYYMLKDGVYYPEGGVGAIPHSFHRLALDLGVKFQLNTKVTGVSTEKNRVVAVNTDAGSERTDFVISNLDRLSFQALISQPMDLKPSFSYFTIHWGLRKKLENTSHHMLLIPKGFEAGFERLYDDHRFPDPAIIYLNVTNETDPIAAPHGCTNLFAVISCPACEEHLDWQKLQIAGREEILKALARHGWSFTDSEIVFERIQTPEYFQAAHGSYKGSLYGPDEQDRLFGGLFPLKCKDDRYKNLFYAGGSVQPGAGLPMVTLSGQFAADLIANS